MQIKLHTEPPQKFIKQCGSVKLILPRYLAAWEEERNEQKATVNWRFTNQDARVKLERLYPQLDLS